MILRLRRRAPATTCGPASAERVDGGIAGWPFFVGVSLGVAAALAGMMLIGSERGRRSREELLSSLAGLRERMAELGERVSCQSQHLLRDQRNALEEAVEAGQEAADERSRELRARLRKV